MANTSLLVGAQVVISTNICSHVLRTVSILGGSPGEQEGIRLNALAWLLADLGFKVFIPCGY